MPRRRTGPSVIQNIDVSPNGITPGVFSSFASQPAAFQSTVYHTGFLVTMNTNSTALQLSKSTYSAALNAAIKDALAFPYVLGPRPDPRTGVYPMTRYVVPADSTEQHAWWSRFAVSVEIWGKPEVGPNRNLHHMHAVVLISHHNYARVSIQHLRQLIYDNEPQIKYANIDLIHRLDFVRSLLYAIKSNPRMQLTDLRIDEINNPSSRTWASIYPPAPPFATYRRAQSAPAALNRNAAPSGPGMMTRSRAAAGTAPAPVRGPGRPRGSLNRPVTRSLSRQVAAAAPARGRPRSSRGRSRRS